MPAVTTMKWDHQNGALKVVAKILIKRKQPVFDDIYVPDLSIFTHKLDYFGH